MQSLAQSSPIDYRHRQLDLELADEIIVDLFAGGGGMSTAIELATGQHPHIACNHDIQAISMHEANHPQTEHYHADVFEVCPLKASRGRKVGLLHASPDCTHHSQAAGGQPRNRKIRALSWVVKRWAAQVMPRVITLENVKQITKWGPLVAKRCPKTGRVLKRSTDGGFTVAAKGEVVPVSEQFLIPCPKRTGKTWQAFVRSLEKLGYTVDWRMLKAADYGAPTTRERLFMVARRDGQPINWPLPTHFKNPLPGQKKWRSAKECIDWSEKGKSIFMREKPLAASTMKRIAKGINKFVLSHPDPFVVKYPSDIVVPQTEAPLLIHYHADKSPKDVRGSAMEEPLQTQTTENRHALTSAILIQAAHGEGSGKTKRRSIGSNRIDDPVGTVTASGSGGYSVAAAYLMQANGGFYDGAGNSAESPLSTITNTGSQQQLVSACLIRDFGASIGSGIQDPVGTIMTNGGGGKTSLAIAAFGTVRAAALNVAVMLHRYGQETETPLPDEETLLESVTVSKDGIKYYIIDITLRMLLPKELYKAQGFPDGYIFEYDHLGRPLSKTAQIRMCGNSVSPPPAAALIRANLR